MSQEVIKERRCENCECNTLRQYQVSRGEPSAINWRIVQWFCHDCNDYVETKLVEIDWRKKECNSAEIMLTQLKADRRLETIQKMKQESFERLARSI